MDWHRLTGRVHDMQRIDFIDRYPTSLRRATAGGLGVRGYFQWSIIDNFEWTKGYNHRFGLIMSAANAGANLERFRLLAQRSD